LTTGVVAEDPDRVNRPLAGGGRGRPFSRGLLELTSTQRKRKIDAL
jgi:hypothetical protein